MKVARLAAICVMCMLLVTILACTEESTTYQLTTSIEGQGSVSPSSGTYESGSTVTLTAMSSSGWRFDHWGDHASGNQNPITITMNGDRSIYAYFVEESAVPTPTYTPEDEYTPTPTPEPATPTPTAEPTTPGPVLVSPSDDSTSVGTIIEGTSTAQVILVCGEVANAQSYEYQISYDESFSLGSMVIGITFDGTQAPADLYLGEQYYWRVRVCYPSISQWSEVWSFTTPLGPVGMKPVITYPGAEGSYENIELTPTLTWTSTVECDGYEVVVAENCDWSNPFIDTTVGCDTSYAITNELQQGTNYCWKVRAVNTDPFIVMSPWSDTGTFTTIN